eukprot:gene5496-5550_t
MSHATPPIQVGPDAQFEPVGDFVGVPATHDVCYEGFEVDAGGRHQRGDDRLDGALQAGAGGGVGLQHGAEIGQGAGEEFDGVSVGACGVGFDGHAQAGPDVADPGLDGVVGEHAADGLADFGGAGGFVLDAGDFTADPFVERFSQVGIVFFHAGEFGVDEGHGAARDGGADGPADEAATLFADAAFDGLAQGLLAFAEQFAELDENEAEHLLVASAFHQAAQGSADNAAGGLPTEDAGDDAAGDAAGAAVFYGGEDAGQQGGEGFGGGAGGARVGQELLDDAGEVEPGEGSGDFGLGEDVAGDEAAEGAAEALLLLGDDGGVRDRQAERVAEQRGDGEPVGDAADESGLGGGLQELLRPTRRYRVAGQGESGHEHEQAGGEGAVAGQAASRREIRIGRLGRVGHGAGYHGDGLPATVRHGALLAVDGVSASFGAGLTAIAGPNGAGKTTLLRAIAGLHRLSGGRIEGVGSTREIALLPQSGGIDRRFPITCRELVAFGAWARSGPFGRLSAGDGRLVDAALAQMGLGALGGRLISDLSAGQFQRVLFARLIVQDARIILLDEPFTAVDTATEADLLALLHRWAEEGRIVVAVLHDAEMILAHFPQTMLLARQRIAFGATSGAGATGDRSAAGLASGVSVSLSDLLFAPFEFGFMRRALAGCLALSLGAPPLGVFLVLRRMSLTADVLQHGILPGVALGALVGGLSIFAMGLGGVVAGLAVVLLAGVLSRATGAREDSQFAGVYLVALAGGVAIASYQRNLDLTHLLFGSVLAVDDAALLLMASVSSVAVLGLALLWRPLILESVDPGFLRAQGGGGGIWHAAFMALVVLCVVGGFAALGTLMSVGLMMLPAVAARHWSRYLAGQVRASAVVAVISSYAGLLLSFHADLPAGPAILLVAGGIWVGSIAVGPHDSLLRGTRRF